VPLNPFLPFHLPSISIYIHTYKINCKVFHVKHSAPRTKSPALASGASVQANS
jgi:hypothetical protein